MYVLSRRVEHFFLVLYINVECVCVHMSWLLLIFRWHRHRRLNIITSEYYLHSKIYTYIYWKIRMANIATSVWCCKWHTQWVLTVATNGSIQSWCDSKVAFNIPWKSHRFTERTYSLLTQHNINGWRISFRCVYMYIYTYIYIYLPSINFYNSAFELKALSHSS